MGKLEFWVSLASPYAYLTAMRIDTCAAQADVDVEWKPIALGSLHRQMGWKQNPFSDYPIKYRYMLRDVSREASKLGVEFYEPRPFPQNSLPITQAALVAFRQGFGEEFCKAALKSNFEAREDISNRDTIRDIFSEFSSPTDAELYTDLSGSTLYSDLLSNQTDVAYKKGVFGAPFFFVGDEVYWGNDRLEAALEHAALGP